MTWHSEKIFNFASFLITTMNKIGIIGAGKVGVSLGRYFQINGLSLSGFHDRDLESTIYASRLTHTECFAEIHRLVDSSDVVFFTVPDGMIAHVWEQCRLFDIKGKYFFHCSGVLSSAVFAGYHELGAYACSAHPVCAVRSRDDSKAFEGKFVVAEGDELGLSLCRAMTIKTHNPLRVIQAVDKAKYHAAATISSNLFCALAQMSEQLMSDCGFDEETAHRILVPLMLGNIQNIAEKGCISALTGPMERGDASTIARHLEVLEGDNREVYRLISLRLINMASHRHPDRDYNNILKLLKQ